MLTRSGGAAIQMVVAKVSDLPSPLDAVPGERIIVRETGEVYGLDATTRMWSVIGVLKKVGGKKPEELAAHLDSDGNPHATTLNQVVLAGATAQLDEKTGEVVLQDKGNRLKALLRLLKSGSALRIGPDVGNSTAAIWINTDKGGPAALRVVDSTGVDQFVLESDGSITATGTATFKGGVKGQTTFIDSINARGGINGGDTLNISAKRLALSKLTVTDRGLGIGKEPTETLDVDGNLKIAGQVCSDLSPTGDRKYLLGEPKRRWKTVSTATLNVLPEADETALILNVKPGQKAPIILIGNDKFVMNSDGDVGLGTENPESALDVRGSGITIGKPVGTARVSLADNADGNVQLSFNRFPNDSQEDGTLYSWTVIPGNGKFDGFSIRRRPKGGEWRSLMDLTACGLKIAGDLSVSGKVSTTSSLNASGLFSENSGGRNGIALDNGGASIDFFAKGGLEDGHVHGFSGMWRNAQKVLTGLLVSIDDQGSAATSSLMKLVLNKSTTFDFRKDGALFGRSLGDEITPWAEAHVGKLSVGQMVLTDGVLSVHGDLDLQADSGAVRIDGQIILRGKQNSIESSTGALALEGDKTISLNVKAGNYGIDFPDGGATISNVGKLSASLVNTSYLSVNSASDAIASLESNGRPVLSLSTKKLSLNAGLNVSGFAIDKLQEIVDVSAQRIETKFKLPAGVRVEAVVAQVIENLQDVRFFQIGDASTPDRFLGASTKTSTGGVSKGLSHCDRGQSVQNVEAPLVITTDAPPSGGKLIVTVFFMNPNTI